VRTTAELPALAPLVGQVVLLEIAAGTALASYGVDVLGRVGRGFVGTTALICAALMGVDLLVAGASPEPGALLGAAVDAASVAGASHWAIGFSVLLLVHAGFCVVGTDAARRVVGAGALAAGLIALVDLAIGLGPALGGTAAAILAFVPAALLAGAALSGMLLGHWYLISPNLSFRPLRLAIYFVFAAVALQLAVIVGVLVTAGGSIRSALIGATYGLPFWLLVVGSGIVFTAAVSALTLYFARIRANQPATAMLYVLIISVVMGVVPAHLLFFLTTTPV
jgi:hypothetical protein